MKEADVIAFATPVYYYGLAGQLKTLLDRANCLFPSDYRFRDIYLLASAAEDEATTMDGPIRGIQGWIDCFEKARLAGTVFLPAASTTAAISKAIRRCSRPTKWEKKSKKELKSPFLVI